MLATNKKVKLTHNRLEVSLLTKDKSFDETFFPPLPLLKETITHVNDISSLVDTGEFTNQHDSIFHCTELMEDSYPSALRVLNLELPYYFQISF